MILVLYIQSYLKPKYEYTIIQTFLDKITGDTLLDKYPILIYDRLQDPRSLLHSLFAYTYLFDTYSTITPITPFRAKSKYTLIFNDNNDIAVHLISPKFQVDPKQPLDKQNSNVQYITISLKKRQVLILPMHWHLASASPFKAIMLDDILTATIKSFT